ncbi:MAG: hypothetical protein Q7U51_11935 [Methanoregula sp.]|nr:hypothetical protein [Methanoregula sp.]
MQKSSGIILLFCIAAMIWITGCMSQSTEQTPSTAPLLKTYQSKEDLVTFERLECKYGENDWLYCKGVVKNNDTRRHSVIGYIDVYDSGNIKYDYMMISVNVDAMSETSFEKKCTSVEKHPNSTFMYYISSVR